MDNYRKIEFLSVRYFVYFFLFFLSLYLFINFPEGSDLRVHTRFIEQLDEGRLVVPHFLFHIVVFGVSKVSYISFFYVSCLFMALCVVISMGLIESLLRIFLKDRYSEYFLLFVSLALMFVSAIYFPLINKWPYKGIWSPNPWHNPTFIAARPFALLSFYWYALEVINGTGFKKRFSLMRISVILVLCALIKPSFILAFAPATFVFWLFCSDRKIQMLVKTVLLFLPVLGVLFFQFLFTYYYDMKGDSSIQFCFFDAWRIYAQSAALAILQGTAFPLTILAVMFFHILREKILFFSWILFIIGLCVSGLLCETGSRAGHANFTWTYMFCLNILFIISTIGFLRWVSDVSVRSRVFQIKLFVCISIFLFHLFSGIYYMGYLLSGHVL